MQLKALRPLKYKTRRLLPGDVFEVDTENRDGRIWASAFIAARRAREVRIPGQVAPPPPDLAAKLSPQADDREALRAEYQTKFGKRPFHGWDADTLRTKIAEAE